MRKSRLSQYKQNKLIELFVAGVTARTAAELVNVNKSTAAYYFHRLRLLIYQNSSHLEMFDGEVEADESYFGGHRKGKRGRGAAGKTLTQQLLADARFQSVTVFARRDLALAHDKLTTHIVDFRQPETWQDKVRGDVLFSCLGTTIKAAGSQEAMWAIDHDLQLAFAQAAQRNGVPRYVLVSGQMADANAHAFYSRMKGVLEQAVTALGFAHTAILRPPVLLRPDSDRAGEIWAAKALAVFNALGLLRAYQPLRVEDLAAAMIAASLRDERLRIWEAREIRDVLLAQAA